MWDDELCSCWSAWCSWLFEHIAKSEFFSSSAPCCWCWAWSWRSFEFSLSWVLPWTWYGDKLFKLFAMLTDWTLFLLITCSISIWSTRSVELFIILMSTFLPGKMSSSQNNSRCVNKKSKSLRMPAVPTILNSAKFNNMHTQRTKSKLKLTMIGKEMAMKSVYLITNKRLVLRIWRIVNKWTRFRFTWRKNL